MKLNFWKQFVFSVVLMFACSGITIAQVITIDLTRDGGTAANPTSTGDLISGNLIGVGQTADFDVIEAGTVTDLELTIGAITTTDEGATINSALTSFGIFSSDEGGADAGRINAGESLQISFNSAVFFQSVDLSNLNTDETFSFGSQDINTNNATGADLFDFTGDGATTGLFLAAGTSITLSNTGATGTGIQTITVEAVPEPSSIVLLGLLGLGAVARRRR